MKQKRTITNKLTNALSLGDKLTSATSPNILSKVKEDLKRTLEPPTLPTLEFPNKNDAERTYEKLRKQIADFEEELELDQEIGARSVSSPLGVFHITDIGYWGPDLLIFYGEDENKKPIELIQHYTQVNICLSSVAKSQKKPRRIGFDLMQKLEDKSGRGSND